MTFGDMLAIVHDATASDAQLEWVASNFLIEHEVEPWMELPLWLPDGAGMGLMRVDNSRALAAGFELRPLQDTVRDTLAWARSVDELPGEAGMEPGRERGLLARWDSLR
jgi:2'-hydroxyisoflavone reductase